jgi:hypothetical protein
LDTGALIRKLQKEVSHWKRKYKELSSNPALLSLSGGAAAPLSPIAAEREGDSKAPAHDSGGSGGSGGGGSGGGDVDEEGRARKRAKKDSLMMSAAPLLSIAMDDTEPAAAAAAAAGVAALPDGMTPTARATPVTAAAAAAASFDSAGTRAHALCVRHHAG